jgi:hypothetical protein
MNNFFNYSFDNPWFFTNFSFLITLGLFLVFYSAFYNYSFLRKLYVILFSLFFYYKSSGPFILIFILLIICDYNFATPSIAAKFLIEFQKTKFNNYFLIKEKFDKIYEKLKNTFLLFNLINYEDIIKNFINNENNNKIIFYEKKIQNIINKYTNTKNTFLEKITLIKPSIYREEELTNLNDFIDELGNEIKPKKIDIYLVNGKITLEYKISKYEFY